MNPPPFTEIPFSLARMKSAFWPAISTVPSIFEILLPVTSVKIALAAVPGLPSWLRLGLWVTIPPVLDTTGAPVALLLKIALFSLPTLKSTNLLWDNPLESGLTILIRSFPLALVDMEGPPVSGFILLAERFLALKSLAKTSSPTKSIPPVIKKATIKLKVILFLFLRECFKIFSLIFK